jgi:hypothetical protein
MVSFKITENIIIKVLFAILGFDALFLREKVWGGHDGSMLLD